MNCKKCDKITKDCLCKEEPLVFKFLKRILPLALKQKLPIYEIDSRYSGRQNSLIILGLIIVVIVGLGFSLLIASVIFAANFFSGGIPLFILMGVGAFATFAGNLLLLRSAVGSVLINIFGKGFIFAGLTKNKYGKRLPWYKVLAIAAFGICAMAIGMTLGVLTYGNIIALGATLTFLSGAFPPIAIVLGIFVFGCITALFLNNIVKLLQKDDIPAFLKKKFLFLFSTSPIYEHNQEPKHKWRIIAERVLIVTLFILALALAGVGVGLMLSGFAAPLGLFLIVALHAAPSAAYIASIIILALAMSAQIPFIIKSAYQNVVNEFNHFFSAKAPDTNTEEKSFLIKVALKAVNVGVFVLLLTKAGFDGLLAATGAPNLITAIFAGGGSAFYAVISTRGGPSRPRKQKELLLEHATVETAEENSNGRSTKDITSALNNAETSMEEEESTNLLHHRKVAEEPRIEAAPGNRSDLNSIAYMKSKRSNPSCLSCLSSLFGYRRTTTNGFIPPKNTEGENLLAKKTV